MKLLLLLTLPALALAVNGDSFIIGGNNSTDNTEFKYQGSYRTAVGSHSCGCVLIASKYALTAAHCGGGSSYSALFGQYNRNHGTPISVVTVTQHPSYGLGDGAYPNDIAVVELASDVSGENTEPIVMATSRIHNGTGVISGWGRTCGRCGIPNILQFVEIPIISSAECKGLWGENYNKDVHVCVFDTKDQAKGACSGDSGGPLVVDGDVLLLHGLTSWGALGCSTKLPTAYTRVSTFRPWVCDTTANAAAGCPDSVV